MINGWLKDAAVDIASKWPTSGGRDSYLTPEQRATIAENLFTIILGYSPFKSPEAYSSSESSPLLECSNCHNTESPAGALARHWNHGKCMHCGGYFKVTRA